ncbi:hypothetical protein BXY66_1124 [Shimia isoporae]|uniref:Beta-lactamase-related domain-containing protein n=1 Tax=Shimia isoporae TaxID=647720 RepID=A0A4R1NMV0_9RHOB|nr:serine hydrolase [Shimia isoporae]TCL09081.1 hypothetical protein BXY66_1124 [Shimia isoporae]
MNLNVFKLVITSATAILLLGAGAAHTSSEKPASTEDVSFWDETVESLTRSPWIYEGTNVFGELARVQPSERVRALERTPYPTELENFTFLASNDEEQNIADWLHQTHTDSFLIFHDGKLVAEKYFNGMRADTPHRIHSITKTVLGMAAGQAVEAGKLDPEKLMTEYLPALDGPAFKNTTVRHLLDMTAAIDWTDGSSGYIADAGALFCAFGQDHSDQIENCDTEAGVKQYMISLADRESVIVDGEAFDYRSVLSALLGMVVEAASGESYLNVLAELWENIGAQDPAYSELGPKGIVQTSGGLFTSSRDLLRFGIMMLENGEVGDTQAIPSDWIADTILANDEVIAAYERSAYAEVFEGFHYRNQVWVKNRENGVFYGIGVYGQLLYVNQTANVVMVKLSSQPDVQNTSMYLDSMAAMDGIAETLSK